MLSHRLLTGTLLIVVAIGLFWLDGLVERQTAGAIPPGVVLLLLAGLIVPAAAFELAALLRARAIPANSWLLAGSALAAAATVWITHGCPLGAVATASVLLGGFVAMLAWHARLASPPGAMAAAGGGMLATVYLGLCSGLLLALRHEHAAWVVLGVLAVTKSCDIGAYFTGRTLGKRKLIPWLSPGKTWEGLAGGVALSVIVAVGLTLLGRVTTLTTVYEVGEEGATAVARDYHLGWAALAGVLLALVGHAGDLVMSLFKRDAGAKDSGATLPGFGGVLDVIDSPLLIAPVAYWMLKLAAVG